MQILYLDVLCWSDLANASLGAVDQDKVLLKYFLPPQHFHGFFPLHLLETDWN